MQNEPMKRRRGLKLVTSGSLIAIGCVGLAVWTAAANSIRPNDLLGPGETFETQSVWTSEWYFSHSMLTGHLAADKLASQNGPIAALFRGEESVQIGGYAFRRHDGGSAENARTGDDEETITYQSFGRWHRIYIFVVATDDADWIKVHQKVGLQMLVAEY